MFVWLCLWWLWLWLWWWWWLWWWQCRQVVCCVWADLNQSDPPPSTAAMLRTPLATAARAVARNGYSVVPRTVTSSTRAVARPQLACRRMGTAAKAQPSSGGRLPYVCCRLLVSLCLVGAPFMLALPTLTRSSCWVWLPPTPPLCAAVMVALSLTCLGRFTSM